MIFVCKFPASNSNTRYHFQPSELYQADGHHCRSAQLIIGIIIFYITPAFLLLWAILFTFESHKPMSRINQPLCEWASYSTGKQAKRLTEGFMKHKLLSLLINYGKWALWSVDPKSSFHSKYHGAMTPGRRYRTGSWSQSAWPLGRAGRGLLDCACIVLWPELYPPNIHVEILTRVPQYVTLLETELLKRRVCMHVKSLSRVQISQPHGL